MRRLLPHRKVVKKPNVQQYSQNPKTLGEHVRKRRIQGGLSQREAATALSVTEDCITGWENGRNEPQVQHYPRIIGFLGYYPFAHETETLAGKLKQIRYCHGMSYRKFAAMLCVSEDAAKRWERGKPVSYQSTRELIVAAWQQLPNKSQHP